MNPWHDVVAADLKLWSQFRKKNISTTQKNKWCKEGYPCVKAANSNDKWDISSWDKEYK